MKQLDFIQYVARELSISEEESQELLRGFSVHLSFYDFGIFENLNQGTQFHYGIKAEEESLIGGG